MRNPPRRRRKARAEAAREDAALENVTVWFSDTDNHLLRPDLPVPTPEDGLGWGYQLEALLSYQVDNAISIGVGGRYWHMQSKGQTHFENHIAGGGGSPQGVDWQTTMYGLTAQASWAF